MAESISKALADKYNRNTATPAETASIFSKIKQWYLDNIINSDMFPNEEHPNYHSFQERFTRTPGVVVPRTNLQPGVNATYSNKQILMPQDANSNDISHEAAHSIYDKAGLSNYIPELNSRVPEFTKALLNNSEHYGPIMNSIPSTLSNEGLGYAMSSPGTDDKEYVDFAASKIKDQVLRQTLLKLFQHAAAMDNIRSQRK